MKKVSRVILVLAALVGLFFAPMYIGGWSTVGAVWLSLGKMVGFIFILVVSGLLVFFAQGGGEE